MYTVYYMWLTIIVCGNVFINTSIFIKTRSLLCYSFDKVVKCDYNNM